MAAPNAYVENGIKYGGDFRVGSSSTAPTVIFTGDSRVNALRGDGVHQYNDYITLPTFKGQAFNKINRGWSSHSIVNMLDPHYVVSKENQIYDALAYDGPLNIEVVGPFGINDLSMMGRTIPEIIADFKTYCKSSRALGNIVVVFPEVSAVTTVGGVTGDMLKNAMWADFTAIDPATGCPNWHSFADAFVPICMYAPWGQDASTGCGALNSAFYSDDGCHPIDAGYRDWAAKVQPVLCALIAALEAANYVKPELPSLLRMLAVQQDILSRLAAVEIIAASSAGL